MRQPGHRGSDVYRDSVLSPATRTAAGHVWQAARRTQSIHLLVLLWLPIPFLLVAHQLYFWDVWPFASPRWAVNSDRSFIEILGYLQLAGTAALLFVVGVWRRQGLVYTAWAVTLLIVMLDDALRWHELSGAWLVRHEVVPGLLGLPRQALGELEAWGLMGIPVLLLLWTAHRVSPDRAKQDSWWLGALTVLLMAFGVGVDIVHEGIEEVTDNSVVDLLVTFVEAAGEVGAMTALLAYAHHVVRRAARPGDGP